MSEFSSLCQLSGLDRHELALEFGVDARVIGEWEEGLALPPGHVFRTLDLLAHFAPKAAIAANSDDFTIVEKRTGTFVDNMKLPIHRWFRYSAGFSAQWVESVIESRRLEKPTRLLLDPFAGSGTAMLSAQKLGLDSIGFEPHPFVCRVAESKLGWNVDPDGLEERGSQLLARASEIVGSTTHKTPALLQKCYHPDALSRLFALRTAFATTAEDDGFTDLLWLALTAILRECSHAGTAQWQYVLPNKRKAKVIDPFAAFALRLRSFADDIRRTLPPTHRAEIFPADARTANVSRDKLGMVDLIITSPPYPNNFDYADATRLEMTFWGEVDSWSDLHGKVRTHLMRSCSQHSAADKLQLDTLLSDPAILPIRNELAIVCRQLADVRLERGGRKSYHTMVAAYFCDLAKIWHNLRRYAAVDADICFVIGDSAPYGVYVPADRWLATLAEAAGFGDPKFEKLRDRNIKWKNRKHRVPLKEGQLWLKG